MALESLGSQTAKRIDLAFQLCHDLLREYEVEGRDPFDYQTPLRFVAGEDGVWFVQPAMLTGGKFAVEIRIAVG